MITESGWQDPPEQAWDDDYSWLATRGDTGAAYPETDHGLPVEAPPDDVAYHLALAAAYRGDIGRLRVHVALLGATDLSDLTLDVRCAPTLSAHLVAEITDVVTVERLLRIASESHRTFVESLPHAA